MDLVILAIAGLLLAFLLVYAACFLHVPLHLPIALRIAFSVIPGCILYKTVTALYMFSQRPIHSQRGFYVFPALMLMIIGIAAMVLYHVWRDVRMVDKP